MGFFVLIYLWSRNLTISLCGIVVAYLICYYVQRRRLILYPRNLGFFLADRDDLRRRLSISVHFFPFGVFVLLTSLTLSLPRMLVQEQLGAQQLGYFAAVFHFFAVGAIVVGSVGQTITPHFSKTIRDSNEKQFWLLLALTSLIVFCACIVGAVAAFFLGTPLIRLIYGPGFDGLGPLLCWAMISAGPIYIASLMTSALYAARAKSALVAIQIFVLLATGLLTVLLVARLGVEGAFIASAFASFVQIIACGVSLLRFWQKHLESALFF
jgi:O-antigen/teichoic acid export membrane protein